MLATPVLRYSEEPGAVGRGIGVGVSRGLGVGGVMNFDHPDTPILPHSHTPKTGTYENQNPRKFVLDRAGNPGLGNRFNTRY
jgi:hypothetical protein